MAVKTKISSHLSWIDFLITCLLYTRLFELYCSRAVSHKSGDLDPKIIGIMFLILLHVSPYFKGFKLKEKDTTSQNGWFQHFGSGNERGNWYCLWNLLQWKKLSQKTLTFIETGFCVCSTSFPGSHISSFWETITGGSDTLKIKKRILVKVLTQNTMFILSYEDQPSWYITSFQSCASWEVATTNSHYFYHSAKLFYNL